MQLLVLDSIVGETCKFQLLKESLTLNVASNFTIHKLTFEALSCLSWFYRTLGSYC